MARASNRADPGPQHDLAAPLDDLRQESWKALYSEYGPALMAFAVSRGVRDPEDLVQDTFVATWEYLDRLIDDPVRLRSLLFTIAYRRAADYHRRRGRDRERPVSPQDMASSSPPASSSPYDDVFLRETASAAMEALSELSDREQRLLWMRVVEELPTAEVALRLGLTAVNVRVVQSRALAKMRTALTGKGHLRLPLAVFSSLPLSRHFGERLPARGVLGDGIRSCRDSEVTTKHPEGAAAASGAGSSWIEAALSMFGSTASSAVAHLAAGVIGVAMFGTAAFAAMEEPATSQTPAALEASLVVSATAPDTGPAAPSVTPPAAIAPPETPVTICDHGDTSSRADTAPEAQRTPGLLDPRDLPVVDAAGDGSADLGDTVGEVAGETVSLIADTTDVVSSTVETVTETLAETASTISNAAGEAVSEPVDAVDAAAAAVTDAAADTVEATEDATAEVVDAASDTLETTTDTVDETVADATSATDEAVEAVTDEVEETTEEATDTTDEVVGAVSDGLSGLLD